MRRMVSTEAASAAKQSLDARVTTKPAARQLGLSVARVKQLMTQGVLKVSDGRLNRDAVDALRQNLLACADSSHLPRDGVPLGRALRFNVPVCRTGDFLGALLRKDLSCYLSKATERAIGLVVSLSDVRAWLPQESAQPKPWMTLPEVADVLGLKQQVVYHFVRKGLIHVVVQQVGKRKAKVVTHQALSNFKSSFGPLARIASQAGIDHRNGLRWANAEGLEVASGPTVDGGRQYLVRLPDGCHSDAIDRIWPSFTAGAAGRNR